MFKIYYLFCEKEKYDSKEYLEALFLCNENDSIEQPLIKTGVYDIGNILSKTMQVLNLSKSKSYKCILSADNLSDGFNKFCDKASFTTFANELSDDIALKKILEFLLTEKSQALLHNQGYDKTTKWLKAFMDYTKKCQEEKDCSSLTILDLISQLNGYMQPNHYTYIPNSPTENAQLDDINQLLTINNPKTKIFNPALKQITYRLFQLEKVPEILTEKTTDKNLTSPLTVFEINNIADLIYVSLFNIFKHNFIIRKCCYCQELFVTSKRNQKYCPSLTLKNSCYSRSNRNRQLKNLEKNNSAKTHKSIRTQLKARILARGDKTEIEYKIREKEHKLFLNRTKELRKQNLTSKQYIEKMTDYRKQVIANSQIRKENPIKGSVDIDKYMHDHYSFF